MIQQQNTFNGKAEDNRKSKNVKFSHLHRHEHRPNCKMMAIYQYRKDCKIGKCVRIDQ